MGKWWLNGVFVVVSLEALQFLEENQPIFSLDLRGEKNEASFLVSFRF